MVQFFCILNLFVFLYGAQQNNGIVNLSNSGAECKISTKLDVDLSISHSATIPLW